ncbi:hypothetical protein AMECASPLE_000636 [Ameca splendens]|uniref:Uncharacterized protein n=1 Tax=Ameca splendens TaxID=208324 RepID=A0ABV1A439_9TELE
MTRFLPRWKVVSGGSSLLSVAEEKSCVKTIERAFELVKSSVIKRCRSLRTFQTWTGQTSSGSCSKIATMDALSPFFRMRMGLLNPGCLSKM